MRYIDTFGRALWMLKRVQRGSLRNIMNLTYSRLTLSKWLMARTCIETFGRALWMLKRVQRVSIRVILNLRNRRIT